MKKGKRARYFLSILCTFIVISCSTTKMMDVWKDTNYQGGASQIFVIATFVNPDMRRLFEEEFLDQLKAHGVNAFPSYRAIPSEEKLDKDTIRSKMQGLGVDSVLITESVGRNVPDKPLSGEGWYRPGQDLYNSYTQGYSLGGTMLSSEGTDIIVLETELFSAKSEKSVWAARAKISMTGSRPDLVKSYVKKIVDKLASDGLMK